MFILPSAVERSKILHDGWVDEWASQDPEPAQIIWPTYPLCFMLGGFSMQTANLIFKSVSWLFLGISMGWNSVCFGPFVVGLRTTWGSAEWVRTLLLCRLNHVQTSQKWWKSRSFKNIRNKNKWTETNIHLLFTPPGNVYVWSKRGASSRHQVNASFPACYKVTVGH